MADAHKEKALATHNIVDDALAYLLPPKPYSALIFDCDGTLADTMPIHYQAWRSTLVKRDADIFTEAQFYRFAGIPSEEIIRRLNQEFGYDLDPLAVSDEKEQLYVELLDEIREIRAVVNIARSHFGKVPMAVASGGYRWVVEKTLNKLGLLSLFQSIVTAEDVLHGKPAPDIFLLAASRLGVPPSECVVYEDGDTGLIAAKQAGMRSIDVRRTLT